MLQVASQERCDVWPCLADDEVVDVEKFSDAGERGVALVGSVGGQFPAVECNLRGDEPGNYGTRLVFAEEAVGVVEVGAGSVGGEGGGPDKHVGRCDVVQEGGHAAATGRSHSDIQHSFCTSVGFLKSEVADVGTNAFLEDVNVQKVAFSYESCEPTETCLHSARLMARDESLLLFCS